MQIRIKSRKAEKQYFEKHDLFQEDSYVYLLLHFKIQLKFGRCHMKYILFIKWYYELRIPELSAIAIAVNVKVLPSQEVTGRILFFVLFSGRHLLHMEVPRQGVKWELQLWSSPQPWQYQI